MTQNTPGRPLLHSFSLARALKMSAPAQNVEVVCYLKGIGIGDNLVMTFRNIVLLSCGN